MDTQRCSARFVYLRGEKFTGSQADLAPFSRLLDALRRPFDDDPSLDEFAQPAPRELTASYRTFCGT